MGYSWSLWLVPFQYKKLQKEYEIAHIPHITLHTRQTLEQCLDLFMSDGDYPPITVSFENPVYIFPTMYGEDDEESMKALGWYTVPSVLDHLEHAPHMTLRYFKGSPDPKYYEASPPPALPCFLTIADTTRSNPSEWKLYP